MSIYEARLQADLEAIGRRVDGLGALVVASVEEAVAALVAGDQLRSYRVGLDDLAINRETRAIDALCHEFVARHFPAAGHLRFVSSVLRLDVALERIGDYAVNIARRSVLLHKPPGESSLKIIRAVGTTAVALLQEALSAWSARDAVAARPLIARSRAFTKAHLRRLDDLVEAGDRHDIEALFVVRDVLHNLIRVGAQARNVCEETIFTALGETKSPKVYDVLFVGDTNANLTLIAEAYANKAFPHSGNYRSAGWAPSEEIDPELASLAEAAGLDLTHLAPETLSNLGPLDRYHVIVALQPGAREHLGDLPYSTVFLQWQLDETQAGPALVHEVCSRVRDLMIALRGPEAN